jgi:hypothetical protein
MVEVLSANGMADRYMGATGRLSLLAEAEIPMMISAQSIFRR